MEMYCEVDKNGNKSNRGKRESWIYESEWELQSL
jgi:hypothetical protein